MHTDPFVHAVALARQQEAHDRARNERAARQARTSRRAARSSATRRVWRRPRRAPVGAQTAGVA